jgi:predicted Zn-dependent peptidase
MPGLETAAVGVWVNAGARCESSDLNGVSHMLEHMAFKGTQRRSAVAIAEEIESVGGYLNAYTSREHTAYIARVMKDDIPLAVDILADILQHTTMLEEELVREREVVIQEIARAYDTPNNVVFDLFQETAYPNQPLGRSILGTAERVSRLSRDELIAYMDTHYSANRMVVVAAGRVDHDTFTGIVSDAFNSLQRRDPELIEPAVYSGGDVRKERELEQVHIVIGFNGVSYEDPEFFAQQVLSIALGGGMSSRLFQEVREKRGLAYSVFSFATSYIDSGVFGIYAGASAKHLDELVPVICNEVIKIAANVDEKDIDRARAQLKSSLLMMLESPSARCEQMAGQMLIYGRLLPADEIINRINAVDAAALTTTAQRMISNGKPTVAALGPVGEFHLLVDIARFG